MRIRRGRKLALLNTKGNREIEGTCGRKKEREGGKFVLAMHKLVKCFSGGTCHEECLSSIGFLHGPTRHITSEGLGILNQRIEETKRNIWTKGQKKGQEKLYGKCSTSKHLSTHVESLPLRNRPSNAKLPELSVTSLPHPPHLPSLSQTCYPTLHWLSSNRQR